jgi:predicted Zn-dependent protease
VRAELAELGGEEALGAPATLLLAAAALAEGDARAALAHLERATASGAALDDFRTLRARCHLALDMPREARDDLEVVIASEPENADALGMLADCALRLGDAETALERGMASAALSMANPRVHFTIGRAFMALGSPREAITALEAACALAPGWGEAIAALEAAKRAQGGS